MPKAHGASSGGGGTAFETAVFDNADSVVVLSAGSWTSVEALIPVATNGAIVNVDVTNVTAGVSFILQASAPFTGYVKWRVV